MKAKKLERAERLRESQYFPRIALRWRVGSGLIDLTRLSLPSRIRL
jgi:hypothetical protein